MDWLERERRLIGSEAVEKIANSGRFRDTLALALATTGMRPFQLFLLLGEKMSGRRHSLDGLTKLVWETLLSLGLDFYGARGPGDSDGRGVITVNVAGQAAWYTNPVIPTLGSIFDPAHPEYCRRLHSSWAEPLCGASGSRLGAAFHVEDLEGPILLEAELQLGRQVMFWSHRQESLYTRLNHERPDSSDWGILRFAPLPEHARPLRGPWRIRRALAYLESPAFQKGVWTEESQQKLNACRSAAERALKSGEEPQRAALALEGAILSLRWGDTRYPDPYDLPLQATLPDPFRFF